MKLINFVKFVDSDDFWKAFIVQIHVVGSQAGDGFIAPERAASIRKVERQEKRVRVTFGPVRALEGPGYVVSWFAQRTASPDGGAETGVRRLYWEKQGDGEYRIVGMAWAD